MDSKIKDTIFSILMFLLGDYVVFEGIRMYHKAANPPYNIEQFSISPAMLPVVLGSGLILLSIILFIRSFKGERFGSSFGPRIKTWFKATVAAVKTPEVIRMMVGLAMMFVLTFVLLGLIPFVIGGTIFMFCLMMYLKAGKWWKCALISVIAMSLTFLLFQVAFKTPLP